MNGLLAFRDLWVVLGGRAVLRDARAAFERPELVALVGPNGAGKTTLVKALVGLVPHQGAIDIDGRAAAMMDARARALQIGYLPQGHSYHWPLPARDIVALGRYAHGARDPSRLSPDDTRIVDAAMTATGTTDFARRPVTELSGGERARIALARVLTAETPIILADEPIASLDPRYQIAIMTLLKKTADDGRLVIVVLHDLALAWRFADRVIAIHEGEIVADGAPSQALTPALLEKVFGVRATFIPHDGAQVLAALDAV